MFRQIRSQAVQLNKEERQVLRKQIRKEKNRKIADRLRVILYKAEGEAHQTIASRLQMGINQVTKFLRRYLRHGLEALYSDHYQGSAPKLTSEQQLSLAKELKTKIYHTAQQIIAWVKDKWGISYEVSGMHKLLKRMGFTYKKNRLVPSKADPEAQRQFINWFKKLRAEMGDNAYIYFADAVHFKHNAEAGYAWSIKGEPHVIPTNSGRQRYNVLGAYCTQTHDHVFILTENNINQDKIIELLQQLRAKHKTEAEIYLILDNASYNRAKRVKDQGEVSNIQLKYQPPYSPNLNLIERLWKFTRKKFCKDKYRGTFAEFCEQLDDFFKNLARHRADLATLLIEKFELVPSVWKAPELA